MSLAVYDTKGRKSGRLTLPPVFKTPVRPDLIKRAYLLLESHRFQPQGRDPLAGERTSAESWGVGRGMARPARVKGTGTQRSGQAGGVASVVKGRLAHPPRSEKRIHKRLNKKEKWLATASAIAATGRQDLISKRGHRFGEISKLPIIVSDILESISKTRALRDFLAGLGLEEELLRLKDGRKVPAGRSRRRARGVRTPKGPLIVISRDKGIKRSASGLPGVDCLLAKDLSLLDLAPGSVPGRLAIWTRSSFKSLPPGIQEVAEKFGS